MSDFRLKVFVSVARNLNFTKASKELFISQPAISKHIQELENQYKITLFNRIGNRIELTQGGQLFLSRAEAILENYRALEAEMNNLTQNFSGELRLGASTTIAQYMLPEILANFMKQYPNIKISLISENSSKIEELLHDNSIDLGLVEGNERRHDLKYSTLAKDELVLVTNTKGIFSSKDEVSLEELAILPLVLREIGSGTLSVVEKTLLSYNIKLQQLNLLIQLGSTESIKLFLQSIDSVAILSVISVTRELLANNLKVIDIDGITFEREFAFVSRQGILPATAELFMEYAVNHNKKLSTITK